VLNLLLFPAMFFVLRYTVAEGVSRFMAGRQRNAALRVVNGIFTSTIVNVTINVTAFLVAIYGLRGYLPQKQLVLAVSTVYVASVLHVGFKFALNAWWICDLSRYLLRHGVHGPKAWLRAHVAQEVQARFQQMGLLTRVIYLLSGAPAKADLIEILTREIWRVVATKALATLVIAAIYIALFSLYTRPVLMEEATRLNWVQAFLWPFGFSVDYFFHTNVTRWIESALDFG
jgi:hypothetical protein